MTMADEEDVQVHLLHLPATVLVAVLDCLGDAGEVVRTATACKALWHVAKTAHFRKVHTIRFHCYHPELQHVIPRLVQQFPDIRHLCVSSCSALPESWLQPMCVWPVQQLDVSNMWHWDGTRSACLLSWAPSLTHLIADRSGLPIAAAAVHHAAAAATQVTGTPDSANTVSTTALPSSSSSSGAADGTPAAAGDSSAAAALRAGNGTPPGQQQQLLLHPDTQAALHSTRRTPSKQEPRTKQQQQQWRCNAAQWPVQSAQLQQLQLRHLLADNPIRCRMHASSDCSCPDDTLLSQLLSFNSHLTTLDLSHNPMLPDRLLHWALTSTSTALQTLNLSGCELLKPGYVGTCCPGLRDLDLSSTGAGDADVALLASGLSQLSRLNLHGCRKVTDVGVCAVAVSHAVLTGTLQHLDVGCLTRTTAQGIKKLVAAVAKANSSAVSMHRNMDSSQGWSRSSEGCAGLSRSSDSSKVLLCEGGAAEGRLAVCASKSSSSSSSRVSPVLLHFCLSRTSGVNDAVLEALLAAAAAADSGFSIATTTAAAAPQRYVATLDDLHLADTSQTSLQLGDGPGALNTAGAAGAAGVLAPWSRLPSIGLCGLELAGCNNISGFVLQQLARMGLLSGLTTLDLSDVEALRQPSGSWNVGANMVAVAGRHIPAAAAAEEVTLATQLQGMVGNVDGKAAAAAAAGHDAHMPLQFEATGRRLVVAAAAAAAAAAVNGHDATEAATTAAAAAADAQKASQTATKAAAAADRHAIDTTSAAAAAAADGHNVTAMAAAAPVAVPTSVLGWLFAYSGSVLASLTLDGCHLDDATAAFIGLRCPQLRQLSLVGCRGLQSAGLSMLLQGCSTSLKCLQLGGSHSRWRESESLSGVTGLTEFRLLRRSSVRDAELAPILAANSGLKSLALVGCYSCTDELFALAMHSDATPWGARNASSACGVTRGNACWQQQPVLQQHLTQLVLTACDGITGSNIARLRALRHLRVSYCTSFSIAAVQQIVLSCTKLVSLELPAQLQRQLSVRGTTLHAWKSSGTGGYAASSRDRGAAKLRGGSTRCGGSSTQPGFSQAKPAYPGSSLAKARATVGGFGWAAGARASSSDQVLPDSLGLPQQGSGGHLHGLKVVGI